MKNSPPKLAQRFFSWYCRNQLHDSILGDLDEQFYQNINKHGIILAKLIYWMGVFLFLNRFTLKRDPYFNSMSYKPTTMIKTNLIISFRFLSKNKWFTLINVFGLTLGFVSILFILLFVHQERSFDRFHQNVENVYRINISYKDNSGNFTTLVNTPPAMAIEVSGKYPELKKISRMRYAMNCLFKKGEVSFYEDHGYYADSLFLEILQFDFSSGDPETALDEPNSIVITEELAIKYFKDSSPLGATLMFNNSIPLKVTGVLSEIPTKSHLNFNFLISFQNYVIPEGYRADLTSQSWLGFLTYVELEPDADPKLFEDKLTQYFDDLDPNNEPWMLPIVQNLSDIYLGSIGMSDDLSSHIRSGNPFTSKVLLLVAVLILIIAGFNFANLTNALSINRSKSTGIRKVMGASKKGIITQILTESLMISCFCLILSFVITLILFPSISQLIGWEFRLEFNTFFRVGALLFIVGILTGLLSGIYPAFTLARLNIIKSLKEFVKTNPGNPFQFKNILVLLQFAISIGFISATIVMTQQINYLINKDKGFSAENVVVIKMLPEDISSHYDVFKEQLTKNTSVIGVSRSERSMGEPLPFSIIKRAEDSDEDYKRIFFNTVDYDYFKTMGIPISEGRSFSSEYADDSTRSIIINERAKEFLGLEDPIGHQLYSNFDTDGPRTVIGVVEDFNYTSLHEEIGPTVMFFPFIDLEYVYVRLTPGSLTKQIDMLEETWFQVSPGVPLAWKFLDNNMNQLYQSEKRLSLTIQVFSILTILLACLGLYGIVAFMVNNKIKEFGIRKVLGASVQSLYILFVGKYIYLMLIAMVIITPLTHYFLSDWMENFAYHIHINWFIYPLATITMIIISLITITLRILQAINVNPTRLLSDE
ncbi:MAG: ABC transporter permease [Bacteroidota bacterium]